MAGGHEYEWERLSAALPAYVIGEQLGRGAFGVVWGGEHANLKRRAAVKQLSPSLIADPAVKARFVAEARVLASLDHPHVVSVYDYDEIGDLCLLAMDRLDGG